jgi:hypothetical protein
MRKRWLFTRVRTLEPTRDPDLGTLLTALYVELTDRIIPSGGFTRRGPGKPPDVTDAELVCRPSRRFCCGSTTNGTGCAPRRSSSGTCSRGCCAKASTTTASKRSRR